MEFPKFITSFPGLDLPFGPDIVKSHAVRSDAGLVVFFDFLQDVALPEHSHKGQWGTVIEGEIALTIGGVTRRYQPGESYAIAAGTPHAVQIKAGTKAIDVFEEPDRYRLKT